MQRPPPDSCHDSRVGTPPTHMGLRAAPNDA